MKTTRWVLGALVLGGLLATGGCTSSGTYRIPTVAPVVKQTKSEDDDLLKELEGDDTPEPKSSGSKSSGSKGAETKSTTEAATEAPKADATKAEEPKADAAKAEEPTSKTDKAAASKADAKTAPKPAHKKK